MRKTHVRTADMLDRIASCLRSTDMTMPEIARRFGISKTVVGDLNKRLHIREYSGRSFRWTVGEQEFDRAVTL